MRMRFFLLTLFLPLFLFASSVKPLIITGDKDYAPYTYLDSENHAQGLLVDVWKEWGKVNNIAVVFDLKEWAESIDDVKHKKADIHSAAYAKVPNTYKANAIYKSETSLFARKEYHLGLHSQRVGVIDPYFGEVLKRDYPKITIVPYDNYDLLFDDVKNEKIDLFFDTQQAVLDASNMSDIKTLFTLVRHFSNTIHTLQQERGASAGFISSNGRKFHKKLKEIRKKSDLQIKNLLFYFNLNATSLQNYFDEDEYAALNTKFNHLYILRKNIDSLKIKFSKSYSKYTQHIASLLLNITDISDKVENKQIRDGLYVYSTLLMYKESIGQKRAALSSLFSKNDFFTEIFEYYLTADTQEKIYLKTFKHSANAAAIKFYNKTMDKDLLLTIKAYENLGKEKLRGADIEVDPEAFYEDISQKINQVKMVKDYLDQKIMQNIDSLQRKGTGNLAIRNPYKIIPLPTLYFFDMYPLVTSEEMVKKINEGFAKVPKSTLEAIEKKWLPLSSNYYSNTIFTKEEQRWIKDHPSVRVGGESTWAPFEFTNAKGEYAGYANDYLKEIEKISGLHFDIQIGQTWVALLKALEEKKVDILPAIYRTPEREASMSFSSSYLQVSDYIYINKKRKNISALKELEGKSIAVVSGYKIAQWLQKNHPKIKLIEKSNVLEALIALDTQEVDAFIGDNVSTAYIMKENFLKNIKIASAVKEKKPDKLHMAIRKDADILLSIINKSLQNISAETTNKIEQKWYQKIDNVLNKNTLNIAVGYNRPPFMFGKTSKKGIELDLASKALVLAGYNIGNVEQVSFRKAQHILQKNENMNVAVNVQKMKESGLFYSDPFMAYDNVVITRKKDHLVILSEEDLLNKTVVAWKGANKVLGTRFHTLFKEGAKTRTQKYKEIADQTEQHRAFFTEQAQAIIVDRTMFEWQKHHLKEQFSIDEAYEIHDIFPKKTYYYVAFKDEKIRDQFNKALIQLKAKDVYKKVYRHYVEGRLNLQLDIANLITQISASYIFNDNPEALKKILDFFVQSIPSLQAIDVYEESTNSLFLEVKSKHNIEKTEKPAHVYKDSFYVGEGNPLKVGHVKLSFDYEDVKNLRKDQVPYLSSFSFLEKKDYKRMEEIYIQYKFLDKKIELSESEKKWLKLHPVIKFTGDPDWLPFEAFNDKGKYVGIFAEYLNKLELLTGITFARIPSHSWSESVSMSQSREVDVLSEVTDSPRKDLIFTDPYVTNKIVIVMLKDHRYVEGLAAISDAKIAMVKDYGYVDTIKQKFPNIPFVTVDTLSEGLNDVSMGKVDALVCTFALASYTITKLGLGNVKIVGKTQFKTSSGLGVRKDYKPLVGILNRAIASISQEEHNEIFNHWIKQEYIEKTDYSLLYKIVGGALLLILLFIFWNRKMAKEIQKRKVAEERIKESQARFSTLFDASPDSIAVLDAKGVYVNCNKATLEIFGLPSKEDFIGTKPEAYSPLKQKNGALSETLINHYVSLAFTDGPQQFNWIHLRKDTQEPFNAEVILSAIVLDDEPHMYAVARDITDRKLLEDTIQKNNDQMTFVSQYANLGFWYYKPQEEELLAMDVFVTMLGYASDDILEKSSDTEMFKHFKDGLDFFWKQALHPDDVERTQQALLAHLNGEADLYKIDYRMRCADGSWLWTTAIGKISEYDEEGKPLRMNGVIIDINDAKKAQKELEEERSKAEAATKSKSEFLANMSHEIRTPMNGIIGMTHLALQTELNNKQRSYLQKVDTSAKSLLGIINDILDFSKIEAGKLSIEKIDFDLYRVIGDVIHLIEIKAEEKGLELVVGYGKDVGKNFFGDSLRISQILTNLLGNAIKFTEKGEVSIYIDKMRENRFRFDVRDTGIGLTQDQVKKLFKSFSQADGSTTRKYGGTGLGLTISKQLVELMGGEIWVESEEGKGSSFIFEIDLEEKRNLSNYNVFGNKTILVVDDNESWHSILNATLQTFGVHVEHAYNGQEAVAKVETRSEPYDLILMDWNMPELNGIEATQKINDIGTAEETPTVVMISAYHEESLVEAAKKSGIDIFLQKPINPSILNDILSGLFLKGNTAQSNLPESKQSLRNEIKTLKGSHILLAEDNETNQEIITGLLEESGIVIEIAQNGQEAVDKYKENPKKYELIFMDLQMPVMDGYEATRQIRVVDKEIQIIALTANAMLEDIEKTKAVGMDEHLNKPIEVEKLYATLLKRLSKKTDINEEESQEKEDTIEIPEFRTIDTAQGLGYLSNDKKIYLKLLHNFFKKYTDFDLSTMDEESFARSTHTLKGLSASIGAHTLNEHVTLLDKTQDKTNLPEVNASLNEVLDELKEKLIFTETKTDESTKKMLSEEEENILMEKLKTALDSMEPETCEEILNTLNTYALNDALKDTLDKINTLIDEYDFDEALALLNH